MNQSFACLLLLSAVVPGQGKTVHPSLGVCTRQEEFARRQEAMDAKVRMLGAAAEPSAREDAIRELVAASEADMECLIRYREPLLVPVFTAILGSKQPWFVRTRAAYALKLLGQEGAVPELAKALADADSMVREASASALGHLGGDAAKAALLERQAAEKDPYVLATLEAMVASAGARPYERSDGKVWKETLAGPEGARRVAFAWT